MKGIHVFETNGPIKWQSQLAAIQLLSALSWKRHHGPIVLYTNEEWLNVLKTWSIHEVYDEIDTETLKELDWLSKVDYWSFGKIYAAFKQTEPAVILDTDLWIDEPLQFTDSDVTTYHRETWTDPEQTHYENFKVLSPESIHHFDSEVNPLNTAILHIKNLDLIKIWFNLAKECTKVVSDRKSMVKQIYVEQRLLAQVCKEFSYTADTFVPQTYISHFNSDPDGSEWIPNANDWSEEEFRNFKKIKHIWGLKHYFTDQPRLKQLVFNQVIRDLLMFENQIPNPEIINTLLA